MSADDVSSTLRSLGSSCENVTHLTLGGAFVDPPTLTMFLSHFAHLEDLSIHAIYLSRGDDSRSGFRHGFHPDVVPIRPCGEFSESGVVMFRDSKGLYKSITLLEPRFRKISLRHDGYGMWRDYWPLLEACAGSLEELHIFVTTTGEVDRLDIPIPTLLMYIQDADCAGLSLACCPNLRTIGLSFGYERPARPCQFIEKCLSTVTSTQLSKVKLSSSTVMPDCFRPGLDLSLWDSLDVILYNLAGQYRPQCEGGKMLVELDVDVDYSGVELFLRRFRERGTL